MILGILTLDWAKDYIDCIVENDFLLKNWLQKIYRGLSIVLGFKREIE